MAGFNGFCPRSYFLKSCLQIFWTIIEINSSDASSSSTINTFKLFIDDNSMGCEISCLSIFSIFIWGWYGSVNKMYFLLFFQQSGSLLPIPPKFYHQAFLHKLLKSSIPVLLPVAPFLSSISACINLSKMASCLPNGIPIPVSFT